MSWTDINPGEKDLSIDLWWRYRPETYYSEGTYLIAPWNEMITYNTLQQSREYSSKVMEKNGGNRN